MSAQSSADMDHLDSLLRNLPDSSRLTTLNEWAYKYIMNGSNLYYGQRLLKEAEKQKQDFYKGNAYFLLARYYYSKNPDSMRYFIRMAEPILLKENRLEELFRMKGWNVYSLSTEGKGVEVIPEAEAVREQARQLNYPDGEDMVDQMLANYYMKSKLITEGTKLYEEVLQRMEKRNVPLVKRINIIRQLQNNNVPVEKQIYYLDKLHEYIQKCKAEGIEQVDAEMPLYYVEYLYHRSYGLIYLRMEVPAKAYYHLKQAEHIRETHQMTESEKVSMLNSWLYYYQQAGPRKKVIQVADELLAILEKSNWTLPMLPILKVKALTYYENGQGMEAAAIYQKYIALNDSVSNAKFYEDLAKLRTQHELDNLELENKKMELEAAHTRMQLLVMGGGLTLLVIVCCVLVYLAWTRHRYSVQMKKAKEMAEEADRLKSAFLANMNHEIRTPLNAIVGFSQVLVEEEDKDTRQELAEIIQNNNELLQRLIEDVLDISKIESNSMSLRYAEVDIPSLIKEIYNITLLKMPSGVELIADEAPPLLMETDRNRLTQVLTNLLNNAIKHTTAGEIRLGYRLNETTVCFFVKDTGEGIPADQLEHIFSRFVQLNSWSKGVGLGLAICRGLVDKMGGKIEVTSEVCKGSVFYVTLPLQQPTKR